MSSVADNFTVYFIEDEQGNVLHRRLRKHEAKTRCKFYNRYRGRSQGKAKVVRRIAGVIEGNS